MKRPTIKDVALRASVSKSTVSHVINATRYVEDETRQRVLQAIEELQYRPSAVARSLTTNRTFTVGVIVADMSDAFFGDILSGIVEVLGPANYSATVCNTNQQLDQEEHYLNLLLSQRVDGIIAMSTSQRWDALTVAEMKGTPLVFVDRTFEGLQHSFVGVNNFDAAYLGAQHLIACGKREIGILAGFQRLSTMRDRLAGFRQALADNDIPLPDEWVVESPLAIEAGQHAATDLLSRANRPEALFINNSLLSLGTLLALDDLGMKCPDDIALIGFDDHPWAAVTCPPLSVIRQPAHQMGVVAAEMLLDLVQGNEPQQQSCILECDLILRQSC